MTQGAKLLLAIAILLAAFALSHSVSAAPLRLAGEVTYRERMALPSGASLSVRLVDLDRPARSPNIAAQAPIAGPGGVPLKFTLDFDSAAIRPDRRYGLAAEIRTGDTLWFSTSQPFAIDPLDPAAPISILVTFVGRPITPPRPEDALYDIVWQASEIEGRPVPGEIQVTLSLAKDGRSGGRGGCNNYFAQSRLEEGGKLDFSAVASTQMACAPDVMAIEARYFSAVDAVASFVIANDTLILSDAAKTEILRFRRSGPVEAR